MFKSEENTGVWLFTFHVLAYGFQYCITSFVVGAPGAVIIPDRALTGRSLPDKTRLGALCDLYGALCDLYKLGDAETSRVLFILNFYSI